MLLPLDLFVMRLILRPLHGPTVVNTVTQPPSRGPRLAEAHPRLASPCGATAGAPVNVPPVLARLPHGWAAETIRSTFHCPDVFCSRLSVSACPRDPCLCRPDSLLVQPEDALVRMVSLERSSHVPNKTKPGRRSWSPPQGGGGGGGRREAASMYILSLAGEAASCKDLIGKSEGTETWLWSKRTGEEYDKPKVCLFVFVFSRNALEMKHLESPGPDPGGRSCWGRPLGSDPRVLAEASTF